MTLGIEKEFDFISPRQKNLIPVNDEDRYIDLIRLQHALRVSWSPETVADWERDKWTPNLPSFGQCVVTALVVQDLFGGKIVKDPENDHYWNIFDDGGECDLSREQIPLDIKLIAKEDRSRDYMLTSERAAQAKTAERFKILREKVRLIMGE